MRLGTFEACPVVRILVTAMITITLVTIYYDLKGQDCLLGCVTKAELACLRSKGLKFDPLS